MPNFFSQKSVRYISVDSEGDTLGNKKCLKRRALGSLPLWEFMRARLSDNVSSKKVYITYL